MQGIAIVQVLRFDHKLGNASANIAISYFHLAKENQKKTITFRIPGTIYTMFASAKCAILSVAAISNLRASKHSRTHCPFSQCARFASRTAPLSSTTCRKEMRGIFPIARHLKRTSDINKNVINGCYWASSLISQHSSAFTATSIDNKNDKNFGLDAVFIALFFINFRMKWRMFYTHCWIHQSRPIEFTHRVN